MFSAHENNGCIGAAGEHLFSLYVYPEGIPPRARSPSPTTVQLTPSVPQHRSMDERDFVKVNFLSEADEEEARLMQDLALTRWERG